MDNLLTIELEAHHAGRNHHRRYQITVGRDLLDDWTVSIRYGRTGQEGRELRYVNANAEELQQVIRERLRRRRSATRRIGCPYRMTSFAAAPDFNVSGWLPADVLSNFLAMAG